MGRLVAEPGELVAQPDDFTHDGETGRPQPFAVHRVRVETRWLASIERVHAACLEADLRQSLARYHDDPDSAFWGWIHNWLHPPFRQWSIEYEFASIT